GEPEPAPGAEPVAWLGLFRDRESGGEWERDGIYDTRPEIEAARSACVADHGYAYAMVPLYASPPSERAGEREMLDVLEDEGWDLRCRNVPTGGDDYDVEWYVVEHHTAAPHEREVAS